MPRFCTVVFAELLDATPLRQRHAKLSAARAFFEPLFDICILRVSGCYQPPAS